MTNPARPPNHPAVNIPPAALAATALATPQHQQQHAQHQAQQHRPAAPQPAAAAPSRSLELRTSAPGLSPLPHQPHASHAPGHSLAGQTNVSQPRAGLPESAARAAHVDPAPLPSSKKPDPYLGTTFDGRYQIEKRLGEGGMGVVYAAKHTMIGKRVAVKVLRNEYASDKDILDRFVQEARTASSIGNPHIVDISDFGTLPDGATYFVMELLEGESLTDVITPAGLAAGTLSRVDPTRICKIALQLCDGLGAAHARDIVHRDLKPDNIFLVKKVEPDFVKILDFGIAKVTNTATQKTRAGQVFGTPHYMSPEQASGRGVDARSDIYSVGVILYEMATGKLPFTDETYMGILTAHMYRSPEPVRSVEGLENFPLGLDAIIQKCLAKHLELRYQSMAQLDADLRRALGNQEPEAVTSMLTQSAISSDTRGSMPGSSSRTTTATPATPKRGASTMIIVAGLVAAVGLVAGALYLKQKLDADAAPPAAATVAVAPTTAPTAQETEAPKPTSDAVAPAAPVTAAPTASGSSGATKTHVTVKAVPATARITVDNAPIANSAVDVATGSPVSVRVEAAGFVPQTVVVDGSKSEVVVALAPAGVIAPPPPPPPPPKTSTVVDTWAAPSASASVTPKWQR